jgi:hypothetical protein
MRDTLVLTVKMPHVRIKLARVALAILLPISADNRTRAYFIDRTYGWASRGLRFYANGVRI